jgi:ABC-type polysaccharide/polyol phosphate transport system ATPase subunit
LANSISLDEGTTAAQTAPQSAGGIDGPVVIEARGVEKTFRIPTHRIDSFKERAVHPFARSEYRELHALRGVSFEIRRGEFFGIVGRNGSGKSTLLKILASIYRADAGRIRMSGRLAPFIELGVGFNADLTARENVALNGVMMGLSRREASRRLDAVLDFAELADFVDLKLKNYSSGMMVRLAFSVMIQADADILLIDEVLAVGDAAFQQKCADVFHEMRDAGRTIVLVSHDMATVEGFCHRAMLINNGELSYVGNPEEVGRRYLRANFEQAAPAVGERQEGALPDLNARLTDAWLENGAGERITNVETGEPLRFRVVVEAQQELLKPVFGFHCINADGVYVFGFNKSLKLDDGEPDRLENGQRARITGTIENQLTPGRYFIHCWVVRDRHMGEIALQVVPVLDFVVFGPVEAPGIVTVPMEVEAVAEKGDGP